MRIGIDARLIPYAQKEGLAYYAFHLIDNLLKNDADNDYVFFYNLFLQGKKKFILDLTSIKNARNKIFWVPGRALDWFWTRVHFPPLELLLGKIDIFHTLSITASPPYFYMPPQIWGRKVITIHDIIPLMFPEKTKSVFNIPEYEKGLRHVVKNADAIICVSKAAQKDLIEFTGIPQNKTYVIYHGIDDDFYKVTQPDKVSEVLNKYHITGRYLFNVSRLDYNKNIVNLIKAFSIFRKNYDFKLVITGKLGNVTKEVFNTIEKLGVSSDIIYLNYVLRQDLRVLFSAAELFVFPSFYETFGFPNLEAMKCEAPVITSDIRPIKEIVGDAALLVNPYSPEEISAAMSKVISDSRLRSDLVFKGKERVKLFSWEKTAEDTLGVYKKVVQCSIDT